MRSPSEETRILLEELEGERLRHLLTLTSKRRLIERIGAEGEPSAAVRREALETYLERMPERAEAKLVASLFDKSSGLRGFCQKRRSTGQ